LRYEQKKIDAFTLTNGHFASRSAGSMSRRRPGRRLSHCNDETQTLNDVQIDPIILKQLQ